MDAMHYDFHVNFSKQLQEQTDILREILETLKRIEYDQFYFCNKRIIDSDD